jgi:hypothetical protein
MDTDFKPVTEALPSFLFFYAAVLTQLKYGSFLFYV